LWCELVLNGIGGTTIAEAQATLTWDEFLTWASYRAKRGSLNTGFRMEVATARLCAIYANFHRRSTDAPYHLEDFAPHMDEREISIEEFAQMMGAT